MTSFIRFAFWIIISITLFLGSSCKENSSQDNRDDGFVIDDMGRAIKFHSPPQRIVSLAPNITEIIFAVGGGNNIVGVTTFCNYPDAALLIAKVGGLSQPNIERITELHPDLIVLTVSGNTRSDFEMLERLGFQIFVSDPRSFGGVVKSIRDIGFLLGMNSNAELLIETMERQRDSLIAGIEFRKRIRTLFLLSIQPIISVTSETFIGELLETAGAENIVGNITPSYPLLNKEEIIRLDPEIIITTSDAAKTQEEVIAALSGLDYITAIKERRISFINADIISRPGPRIIQGLEEIISILHSPSAK